MKSREKIKFKYIGDFRLHIDKVFEHEGNNNYYITYYTSDVGDFGIYSKPFKYKLLAENYYKDKLKKFLIKNLETLK